MDSEQGDVTGEDAGWRLMILCAYISVTLQKVDEIFTAEDVFTVFLRKEEI